LPGLRPVTSFVLMVTIIASANMFGQSFIMTNGQYGTEVLSLLAYRTSISRLEIGLGSAVSVLLFACVLLISFIAIKIFKVDLAGSTGGKR
ncbi:MAG: ABC transporter permease, partial [Actinomycetes bacterium]